MAIELTQMCTVQVLQENHRLETKLGIMREQHALVAKLLCTQLPVDAEQEPKGTPLLACIASMSMYVHY